MFDCLSNESSCTTVCICIGLITSHTFTMPSVSPIHESRRCPPKPTGILKRSSRSPKKPTTGLRSSARYFWYNTPNGDARLVTSSKTPGLTPQQSNDYTFDPAKFAHEPPPYYSPGKSWPPRRPQDLLYAAGSEGDQCIGATCYNSRVCKDAWCKHAFARWKSSMANWQDHFELRKTRDRGIGVYTKHAFKDRDILGWYAGEIVTSHNIDSQNDYLLEVPVGIASDPESPYPSDQDSDEEYLPRPQARRTRSRASNILSHVTETICIDANRQGTWTRFINHSCEPHAEFRVCRVGSMRVMAVEAIRDIPEGVELMVNYGKDYYGPDTRKICHCATANCVGKARRKNKLR
jgi:hypothetical protein